ncbi:hypothetical protein BWI17_14630 [Betaproteobacteria bacterium GR16-43]|nr:hypothetical protein BWI17_14630 [Betaproteobacteria bacterium GR16-43]
MNTNVARIARSAFTAITMFACALAQAAPGDLDTTFGTGGKVLFPSGDAWTEGNAMAVQADGKIVVGGRAQGHLTSSTISRFNVDGSIDSAFGANGNIKNPLSQDRPHVLTALAVQPDGKIVAAGVEFLPDSGQVYGSSRLVVARFHPDGSRDTSFGAAGLAAVDALSQYVNASAVALQPDGGILLAGSDGTVMVLRLDAQGVLDTTFGTGGRAPTRDATNYCLASSLAIQPDGRIVGAGGGYSSAPSFQAQAAFCVVRLMPTGALDPAFATGGIAITNFRAGPVLDHASTVAIAPDGKIVVAGTAQSSASHPDRWAMARYNTDGTLDASFGNAGLVASGLPHPDADGVAKSIALLADGRILLGGNAFLLNDFGNVGYVARYSATGGLDPTFGDAGFARAGPYFLNAIGLAAGGKIAVAGNHGLSLEAARLLADGSVDTSFGVQGVAHAIPYADSGPSTISALLARPDGKLVVIGSGSASPFVVQLNASGGPDVSFGAGGRVSPPMSSFRSALQADGKILLASTEYNVTKFARLNADGSVDNGFGTSGIVTLNDATFDNIAQIVVQPDGKLLALGGRGALARYNTDGSPDATFGNGGVMIPPLVFEGAQRVYESFPTLRLQQDGMIVLVGSYYLNSRSLVIRRYTTAGLPDPGFGNGGRVVTPIAYGEVHDAAIVEGQRILVLGETYFKRYLPSGNLDAAFGNGGTYQKPSTWGSMAIDAQGRMIVAGEMESRLRVSRFNPDGTLDVSFGEGGSASTPVGSNGLVRRVFTIQPDDGIVVAGQTADGVASIARFLGGGGFVPGSKAAFDFDGGGTSDLLFARTDGRAAIWLMNGTTRTDSQEILGLAAGWSVTNVADFNGDGKSDLVWTHNDGRVAIYLMNGKSAQQTAQVLDAGSGFTVTHTPDLDGDGKADLLFQHADGTIAAWTMNGTTITGGATLLPAGTGWSVIRTADFDGDGNDDLLFRHTDGRHAIWLMHGLAVKSSAQILNAGNWTAVHTPDLDGDGKADILWQNTDGTVAAWLMNGTAMSSGSTLLNAGTGWSVTRVGDFNGDGKTDLFFQHPDGRAAIYLMNGLTPTATQQIVNAGGGWSAKRLADLNADGKADIVWEHSDGRVAVWLMNGTSMMSGQEILGPGTGWSVSGVSP